MSERQDIPDWLMSTKGRLARIAFGTVLILVGLGVIGGFFGVLLLLIGAVPIATAAYGALLVGPLFGATPPEERPGEPTGEEYVASFDGDEDGDDEGEEESEREEEREAAAAETPSEPRNLTGAPPLARAERPPGQEPRTKPLDEDE
jgi:hypothetical protein